MEKQDKFEFPVVTEEHRNASPSQLVIYRSDQIEAVREFCAKSGFVGLVQPRHIAYLWNYIEALLLAGKRAWEAYYDLEDIYRYLCLGELDCWLAIDEGEPYLCAITQMEIYPKQKEFTIRWLGGKNLTRNQFGIRFIEYFKYIASRHKCTKLRIDGRAGFDRILGSEFRRLHQTFIADINPYMEN